MADQVSQGGGTHEWLRRRQADRDRVNRVNETLTTGVAALLHACEDCVEEIRFHQDALVKAVERKGCLSTRIQTLIGEAKRHSSTPQDGAQFSGETTSSGPTPFRRKSDPGPHAAGSGALAALQGIELHPPERRNADWPEEEPALAGGTERCKQDGEAQLSVYCFGQCRISQDHAPLDGWPQGKGKAIFKYLLLHRRQAVAKEILMQLFWPDADPEGARNNLNVAIYGIRKILARAQPAISHVLLKDGCYQLNPALEIWVDVDRFLDCVQAGRGLEGKGLLAEARAAYQEAEELYRDELLVEDRGEEWLAPERTRLREMMIDVLRRLVRIGEHGADLQACVAACRRLLEIDPCDEAIHRDLMHYYCRRGQPHLALRQFQSCADALSRRLNMIPSPITTALFRQIQRREDPDLGPPGGD